MTKEDQIMKLQTYKMFEGEDEVYVNRDDVLKTLEQQPCNDCISRQAVLDIVRFENKWLFDARSNNVDTDIAFNGIISKVSDLPPVQPKIKTGHWIEKAEDYYKAINEYGGGVDENTDYFTDDIACPKCLSKFSTIDNETERFRHCPNCGAKMEVNKE